MSIFAYNHNKGVSWLDVVEILKALADETRLRIVNLLRFGPLCVCEIEEILEVNQSNASRHLIRLRNAEIIVAEKQAQWVYYRLNDKLLLRRSFIPTLIENDLDQQDGFLRDTARLKRFKEQGGDCEHKIDLDG